MPNPWSDDQGKHFYFILGIILAVVFGTLAILLITSIIRTMITNPGNIPDEKEWDMQSESLSDSNINDTQNDEENEKSKEKLTNIGMVEDQDDPKEPAHLDYKYLKSFAGPITKTNKNDILEESSSENQKRESLRTKRKPKPLPSFERKKFGGIRMC